MRKIKERPSGSENNVRIGAGENSKPRSQNGIRKRVQRPPRSSTGSEATRGEFDDLDTSSGAIDRIKRASACYTHSGNGKPRLGRRTVSLHTRKGANLYHKQKTLGDAVERCKYVNREWRSKVLDYALPIATKLKKQDRKQLRAMLGLSAYSGAIRASDLAATRRFGLICVDVVHSEWLAARNTRWFHITLCDAQSEVAERAPAFRLKRLRAKAYKEVQELGLNGLGWIDVDPVPNYAQGHKGGSLLFHVHVLAYTDREFDLDAARAKLSRSRSWSSGLRAKPTNIKEITAQKGVPVWWAAYDAKPPYRGKRRKLRDDGTSKLRWCDYRPQLAFRLVEGLAQIARMDLFFGIGEGKVLREDVRKGLMQWHRKRWPDQRPIEFSPMAPFFGRCWAATRVKFRERWRIVGSSI